MKYSFNINNRTVTWENNNDPVDINTDGGYTVEEILNNANVSKKPKYWYNIKGTDKYLFRSSVAESWEFFDPNIENPIRNTNQVYLRFKDVSEFMKASNYYKDNGHYTYHAEGTVGYEKFWDEEEEKIDKGIEVDGVRLTGRHYWTINYGRMRAIPTNSSGQSIAKRKIWTFLRFLDHQYYIFHELDKCFLEGVYRDKEIYNKWFPLANNEDYDTLEFKWFTATKARRKGWSGIIGVGVINYNFTWRESSNNIIAAYEKGRYKPILSMTATTKAFVDQNTPFIRQTGILDQREHFISGIKYKDEDGKPKQVGYLSEVNAVSFKDQTFKAIGECFSPETQVIKSDGEIVEIKDLKKGDFLLGPDGFSRKIKNVHRGTDKMTYFSQNRGSNFACNTKHKHYGKMSGKDKHFTISNEDFLNKNKTFRRYFRTVKSKGFNFSDKTLDIDPYFYGLWLGDGDNSRIHISSEDTEVVNYLKDLAYQENLKFSESIISKNNNAKVYRLTGKKGNHTLHKIKYKGEIKYFHIHDFLKIPIKKDSWKNNYTLNRDSWNEILNNPNSDRAKKVFNELDMKFLSKEKMHSNKYLAWLNKKNLIKNKHVIKELLFTNENTKLRFLAGFIDSDGHLLKDSKSFSISQRDRTILEDTAKVARSLGFYCSVTTNKRVSGFGKVFNNISRLYISGDTYKIPTKIERKKAISKDNRFPILESSIKKQYEYVGSYVGIEVDKDNLFMLDDFTIVHNSSDLINIEEAGVFDNLLEAYPVSLEPLVRDGETIIGVIIAAGTAGDLESGGSEALYEFMYNPSSYNFLAYDNIYEGKDEDIGESGWFIDDLWYSPKTTTKDKFLELDNSERTNLYLSFFNTNVVNTVDSQGNSYRYLSNLVLEEKRKEKKKTSIKAYQKFITQQPKYLSEAFLINENSPFEVAMAKERLAKLKTMKSYGFRYGEFTYTETGQVRFLTGDSYKPVLEFPDKSDNRYGCWVLAQEPVKINGEIPYGRYISSQDPIDLGADESSENKKRSLGSTFILDTYTRQLVAEYTARPADVDYYYEQVMRGLEYFNATLLYERDKGTRLYEYFKNKKKLYLLADEPSILKDRTQDRIATLKGVNATARVNSDARGYLADWTLEDVQISNEETIKRMYTIKFPGVLQEMIAWRKDGNYDRISALGILMIYLRELTIVIDNNMQGKDPMKEKFQFLKKIKRDKKSIKDYINEN